MDTCIFCKLIAKQIPSYIVYEDEHTVAFIDIFGATDGHVMVIHRRHEETMLGYQDTEIKQVFVTV